MYNYPFDNVWFWIAAVIVVAVVCVVVFLQTPRFGRKPGGRRLARIIHSPNYSGGRFHNLQPTKMITAKGLPVLTLMKAFCSNNEDRRPETPVEAVKTDLRALDLSKDQVVWLGHSTCFMILGRRTFLVDPVLVSAAPLGFMNKPFACDVEYGPDDIPVIDYLIITHDHWDHLDYQTIMRMKHRIISIICPLGVGEHFERWGFDSDQLIELDWWGSSKLKNDIMVTCAPARHFSGRLFSRNQTLWASFVIQTPEHTVYLSGDGGYGKHFAEIAAQCPEIDLAIIENGQYDENWCHIHTMPSEIHRVVEDLSPRKVITVHHSRYALARHSWHEPVENVEKLASECMTCKIENTKIGQVIDLD